MLRTIILKTKGLQPDNTQYTRKVMHAQRGIPEHSLAIETGTKLSAF